MPMAIPGSTAAIRPPTLADSSFRRLAIDAAVDAHAHCRAARRPRRPGHAARSRYRATSRVIGRSAPLRPGAAGDAIAVMFDPAITEAEMRRVVTGAGGRIVDGPTTTHAFVLEVPAAQSGEAVQKLRAERMVRFAEPLGARAER